MIKRQSKDNEKMDLDSTHRPPYNAVFINQALQRAIEDEGFLDSAMNLLNNEKMQFPAFKNDILNYITSVSNDRDVISLFQSLDGYIKFKDLGQVRNALEENNPAKKTEHQITDKTRKNPNFVTQDNTTGDDSLKEKEAVNREERKDYPEVRPSAMSQYICHTCGKSFQTRDDIVHHQKFEGEPKKQK